MSELSPPVEELPVERVNVEGRSITELRNAEQGQDVWIVGSGKSVDFFDPEFFQGRRVIAINRMPARIPHIYAIQTDNPLHAHPAESILVLPKLSSGMAAHGPMYSDRDCYRFETLENREVMDDEALSVIGSDDKLVLGCSTMHAAMHFAAYLGAANIFLCGHDGGTLSGRLQVDGYIRPEEVGVVWDQWIIHKMMQYSRRLREALQKHYGCRVYSLSPFVGLTADGYQFAEC